MAAQQTLDTQQCLIALAERSETEIDATGHGPVMICPYCAGNIDPYEMSRKHNPKPFPHEGGCIVPVARRLLAELTPVAL